MSREREPVRGRSFLGRLLPKAAEVVDALLPGLLEMTLPPGCTRPPGALPEAQFLAVCTACGKCAGACGYDAIALLAPEAPRGAGTPVVEPEVVPCHMCEGFPCARVCEPGALQVPEGRAPRIGTVVLYTERCLAYRGPDCGACADWCPVDPPALWLEGRCPIVDGERCVGCGLCVVACPTRPSALRWRSSWESEVPE